MATNIIKTGVNNYFINEDGSLSMQYDPYFNNCFILYDGDEARVKIEIDKIFIQPGGQIVFKYNGNKYIIDDGYRDKLVMAGYIDSGISYEEGNSNKIKNALLKSFTTLKFENIEFGNDSISMTNHTKIGYDIVLYIESINKMISKNIKRSELKLPMYPTERGFDKYSSFYFRVYGKKRTDAKKSLSPEELHHIATHMVSAIMGSKNFSFNEIKSLTGLTDIKLSVKEIPINKTILKWEDDL